MRPYTQADGCRRVVRAGAARESVPPPGGVRGADAGGDKAVAGDPRRAAPHRHSRSASHDAAKRPTARREARRPASASVAARRAASSAALRPLWVLWVGG